MEILISEREDKMIYLTIFINKCQQRLRGYSIVSPYRQWTIKRRNTEKNHYMKNKVKLIEYGKKYYNERIYPAVEISIVKGNFTFIFVNYAKIWRNIFRNLSGRVGVEISFINHYFIISYIIYYILYIYILYYIYIIYYIYFKTDKVRNTK